MSDYYGPKGDYSGGGREYRDRGRNSYQGEHQQRDRSRSRSRDNYGGGYGDSGGRGYGGGGYGGGRGRHGRGGRGHQQMGPRPKSLDVSINYFQVKTINTANLNEWMMYDITILNVKRVKKKDPKTGKPLDPWEFEFIPTRKGPPDMSRFPQVIIRRIIQKLRKDNKFVLVSDGQAICYSNKRLFSADDCTSANPGSHNEKGLAEVGRYGPADTGGHNVPLEPNDVFNDYHIRVKKSVDEDDPDADKMKNEWFRVRLKEVAAIPFAEVQKSFQGLLYESKYLHYIKQATEIIMKSAMFSLMNSFGKSPRKFYFDEDIQYSIINEMSQNSSPRIRTLINDFHNTNKNIVPNIGLETSLKLCSEGNYINTDTCLDYFYREFFPAYNSHNKEERQRVPLLDTRSGSIAGVKVGNLYHPVSEDRREQIMQKLKKLTFHVKYRRQKSSEEWIKRKEELGWSRKRIERCNIAMRKNCRMQQDRERNNKSIIWSADNRAEYSFKLKPRATDQEPDPPEVEHTIYSYYIERYGIKLKYPKMPCIFIGKKEWYPIEFMYQACDKAPYDNITAVKLGYCDEIAGTKRNVAIERTYRKLSNLLEKNPDSDLVKQFGIMRIDQPITLRAKVLPEPTLKFKNEAAVLNDGSWDLRNKIFINPADLPTFAFINMARDGRNGHDYMCQLFGTLERHGISTSQSINFKECLSYISVHEHVRSPNPEQIYDIFKDARKKSIDFFILDSKKFYRRTNTWHKTKYLKEQEWLDCLVIPPPDGFAKDEVGIFFENGPSHKLNDGTQVRIMAGCIDRRGEQVAVDPFDFRYNYKNGKYERRNSQKIWEEISFERFIFRTESGEIRLDDPNQNPACKVAVESGNIETVAMAFVYLPTDDAQIYNFVKCMAHYEFGIPSQCCVDEKYSKQKSKAQFLSNIALKVNTKLMSASNNALAWNTSFSLEIESGIPWINETPTLVIGISLSHGLGQESITIIGASVGLGKSLMQLGQLFRVQVKSDMIEPNVMIDIIKTLYLHFLVHNRLHPERLVLYRNGASDGDFKKFKDKEIFCIRKGLLEIMKQTKKDFECRVSCQSGCLHCTPPITYIVCQTQHSICVVPSTINQTGKKNVLSGTCVDDPRIMDYHDGLLLATKDVLANCPKERGMIFEDTNEKGYDFILTSHGGLKGTSKPIYYRVILNENAVWKPSSRCTALTREKLQVCTYHQSFQYGTATKAVRAIPVVYYSQRLANQSMGYINYLRGKRIGLRRYEKIGYPLVENKVDKHFVHKKNGISVPRYMEGEVLTLFSPYDPNDNHERFGLKIRPPLRPHLSA